MGGSNRVRGTYQSGMLSWLGASTPANALAHGIAAGMANHTGAVDVYFRPEVASLEALEEGEGVALEDRIVKVKDLHFMGNFVRVTVEAATGELLKVNLAAAGEAIRPGARARLTVDSSHLMAFPG